jgi:hypothetical protein
LQETDSLIYQLLVGLMMIDVYLDSEDQSSIFYNCDQKGLVSLDPELTPES